MCIDTGGALGVERFSEAVKRLSDEPLVIALSGSGHCRRQRNANLIEQRNSAGGGVHEDFGNLGRRRVLL